MAMAMNLSSNSQQQRKGANQNIQVYVRVRPLNARERCIRSTEVIDVISPREIMTRHSVDSKLTKKFTFDRTFGPDSRQVDVYSTVVAPLIEEVLSGYNCTVFAYGQTGTGKTHTMVGNECAELKSSWEDDSEIGIIPRALSHLFDELRLMAMEFSMRISYLELYNEELCDLLASEDSTKIRIFDDATKKGSVIIQGLEEIPVHSKDDVYKLLEKGKERRKTATTLMNAQSSRSHTVFSILVHIRENGIDGEEMLKIGKLNLVDLAGSENVSKAGNEKGIRVRETVNINQSLLTLGRVITALVERTPHIPYRESKLTRLLQESLGGRTKTFIIATISPGHKDIEETLSTLEYAHRAKNIQNKPEVNQKLTKKTVLKEYTEEIDKLKRDLMAARDKNGIYLAEETYNEWTLKMESQNRELNEKMLLLKALKDELQNKEKIFNEVSLNLVEKTEELKRSKDTLVQTKDTLLQTKKLLNNTQRRYKEKKVLLESHLKTEHELTNQATQILEVADIATKDTHMLHSTIERRKDVDQKIQSACERFAERMQDNFDLMDENLKNLQENHNSYSKMIIEEFINSTNAQSKLFGDATEKMQKVGDLCEQSLINFSSISEKYANIMCELSGEHKTSLEVLFQELKNKEQELKAQILGNINDLQTYNDEQKMAIDTLRDGVMQKLQSSSTSMVAHATEIQQQLGVITQISESSIQELAQMQRELQNERAIAVQEQAVIDEFVEKMKAVKQERLACADTMNSLAAQLQQNNSKSVEKLQQSTACVQTFAQSCEEDAATAQQELERDAKAANLWVDQCVAKCATLQVQLDNLCDESTKRVDACATAAQKYNLQVEQTSHAHKKEAKRMRLDGTQESSTARSAVLTGLDEDMQRLKGCTAVGTEFGNLLGNQVQDYAELYKKHICKCNSDVCEFKQNELKTYAPTGATPSKRDFSYPRLLAATSPHNSIVKRFRQENDWSDLDMTATIDEEGSDNEEASSNYVQDLSAAETILNSTPLEPAKMNSINGSNLNCLKAAVHPRSASLLANTVSHKPASPALQKENVWNKENCS